MTEPVAGTMGGDGLRAAAGEDDAGAAVSRHGALGAVQVTSRSLASYRGMFALTDAEIVDGRLLDCPAGASSFGAQVRARGGTATSVDSVYRQPVERIETIVREGIAASPAFAERVADHLDWEVLGSPTALVSGWETAADLFLTDYVRDTASEHYVPALLPALPFPDGAFDLAVSGFLLFFYSDVLGLDDHVRALTELARVATEVRVHPLIDSRGRTSPHLDPVRRALEARGIATELRPAPASDLRAADLVLCLRRGRGRRRGQ